MQTGRRIGDLPLSIDPWRRRPTRICTFMPFHSPPSYYSCHLPSILSLLKLCKNPSHLHQLHARIIRKGLEQDHHIASQFICLSISLSSSSLSYTTSFFHSIFNPSLVIWNSLVKGYCERSSLSDTLWILGRMRRVGGFTPDGYTLPLVIKRCASEIRVREGKMVHALGFKMGFEGDVFVGTSLVDMYGKCGEIECARKVFDFLSERNVVSWTALLVGYVSSGNVEEAKWVFYEMPFRNVKSWNAMIRGLVVAGDLVSARKLFDEMPERDVSSFTTMIDGYAKSGDMVSAKALFEQVPERDIVAWTSMISGYVQNGLPNEAVRIFGDMVSQNVEPDDYVLVALMSACSQLSCLELAKQVDLYVSKRSIHLCGSHVLAALVDMNAKCGNLERATALFEEMPKRDTITYCSLIQGFSMHGRGMEAIKLFDRLLKEQPKLDGVAFTVILTACSRAGLVDEGWHYFELMTSKFCLVPTTDHYACMVDLLSRAGRLTAAYDLLSTMPVDPHASAWGALLGACKLHCNIELGELVARRLLELEPKNAGNYVLLSNIYAAADRWVDVSLLREQMRERGVQKIPGRSWIS